MNRKPLFLFGRAPKRWTEKDSSGCSSRKSAKGCLLLIGYSKFFAHCVQSRTVLMMSAVIAVKSTLSVHGCVEESAQAGPQWGCGLQDGEYGLEESVAT